MDVRLFEPGAAGKDIDLAAERTKLTTELGHIEIDAAAIETAGDGQRRGMTTDECNFEHGRDSFTCWSAARAPQFRPRARN